jgi:DedD protein
MPPVLPNEQELNLKKRARRRLVGAIVMVILMLIILPKILQDRAALAPQAAIKISMPEAKLNQQVAAKVEAATVGQTSFVVEPEAGVSAESLEMESAVATKDDSNDKQAKLEADKQKDLAAKASKANTLAAKASAEKNSESKDAVKHDGSFAIQVGVFSNATSVDQLQQKLTQAGYSSHTEKIATTNGDKIRLRAGKFDSRQDAVSALNKLQQAGMPGMVISND